MEIRFLPFALPELKRRMYKVSKWIKFIEVDEKPKTKVWSVQTIESELEIGIIKWRPSWRKYCFFPDNETVFEEDCLRDIADFIIEKTKEHKEPHDQT